jgi:hypothetical protein
MPLKRTQPIESILCRLPDEGVELEEKLTLYTEGLDEFVDFGTHILHWEAKKDITEVSLPIISLLRRVLELTDAISTLLKSRVVDPCEILLRTLFETALGLEYILKTDTGHRALSYLYMGYAERLTYLKRHDPKDSNYKQYQKEYKHGKVFKDVPTINGLEKQITFIQEWINRPEHKEVKDEYNRIKDTGAKEWFSPFSDSYNQNEKGENKLLFSIKDLAKHLNKFDLYEILYKQWSKSVHGTDVITGNFSSKNEFLYMVALRQPVKAHDIANITIRLLEDVVLSLHEFNTRQKNEQYQDLMGKIIWWTKAYHINYTKLIIEKGLQFDDL